MDTAPTTTHGFAFHLKHNRRLVATALLLSLCFFTFGYDGSVIGGALAMSAFIQQFGVQTAAGGYILPAQSTSIITAVPTAGAVIGCGIGAFCSDRYGRKKALFIAVAFSLAGVAIQVASPNVAAITSGRLISNIAIFIFLTMGSTFQNELAPSSIRGILVGLAFVLVALSSVLTAGLSWATHANPTSFAWRLPVGLQLLWPIILGSGLLFVMDSPTFFLIKGDDEKAAISLRKVRQGYSEEEIEKEMTTLKWQAELRQAEVEVQWIDLFRGTNLRRTMLALSIGNFQQLSGVAFAANYATIFFKQIGNPNPFMLVLCLQILAFVGAIFGLFFVDWLGRRTLALTTFVIIFIIDVVVGGLAFADMTSPPVSKSVAAFCLMFGFFFAAGFGPLTYVVSAEMATARLRNKTAAFVFFVISVFNLVVQYVIPYITNPDAGNLGAKTYLIFAGWMLLCIFLTYVYLPETKGRSPAELDEMFAARVPARKFRGYKCALSETNLEAKDSIHLSQIEVQD